MEVIRNKKQTGHHLICFRRDYKQSQQADNNSLVHGTQNSWDFEP